MRRKKNVSLEPSGVLTDREKLWRAMRQLKRFTEADLALKAGVERRNTKIRDYLRGLVKAEIVTVLDPGGPRDFVRYELVRDTGVDAPRLRKDGSPLPDSGQARMWRAMKILRVFSARELAVNASVTEAPVQESTAATYCKWLTRGRYLVAMFGGVGDVTRYRFVRDTGARAPQILRIKRLYDPNTGEVAVDEPVEEAYERAAGRDL